MKKSRLLILLLVLSLALALLVSCGEGSGKNEGSEQQGGNGTPNTQEKENLIYDASSELYIIVDSEMDGDLAAELSEKLFEARGSISRFGTPDSAPAAHEIVIGDTDRAVTLEAYRYLSREEDNQYTDDDRSFVIYSDGSSVAIVYNEDYDKAAMTLAVECFMENFVAESLVHAKGVMHSETFNLIDDYYEPLDAERKEELWAAAEKKLGTETTNALKSMASLYDFNLISWIANLYDPCICVCKGLGEDVCKNTKWCRAEGGGFYFSNSARDNVGYLPDLESTRQALDMLNMSGMTWMYGGNYYSGALPSDMIQAIGRYTQALQCEDGYFRHPQWSHLADYDMRLNRDLSWATTLLNAARLSPYYTTPTGIPGIGAPDYFTETSLSGQLGESSVSAVSKVVAVAAYPAILESLETFAADLAAHDKSIRTGSYGTGSRYSTYLAQINARDRALGTPEDPTPFMDMLYNWYEYHKNPERGTWVGDEANYGGNSKQIGAYAETNGVMKIIGCYSNAKKPYSYGIEAMHACIDVLTTEEAPTGTVDIYNAWIALNGVYSVVIKYNSPAEQEEAKALMTEFRQNCVEEVIASRDKLAGFKRDDGSFSYSPKGGSGISMGMPTQVKGTSEGDVNGALIASADCWGHIASSLGISKPMLFGSVEMYKFRQIIEEIDPVIKQGTNFDYSVLDFEDDEIDEEPAGAISFGRQSAVAKEDGFKVKADPVTGNQYLEFLTEKASVGDSVGVLCESRATSATAYVFEGDFCLVEGDHEFNFQIQVGNIGYFVIIKKIDNKVKLIEASSDNTANSVDMDLGVSAELGEWFRVKIVYYPGDHDTVRIKVYFDNLADGIDELQLIAVSDNYFDKTGDKFALGTGNPSTTFNSTTIYAYSHLNGKLLLDNLAAYRTKDVYEPELDPEKQPLYNIDPPDSPEKVYDFDNGEIPEDITVKGGEPTVDSENGELLINSATELSLPINILTRGSKCATLSFDLNVKDATVGTDILTVTESEPLGKVFTLVFRVAEDTEGKYITCVEKAESFGAVLSTVRIPLGKKVNVTIDYHHDEDTALIFVDGVFYGASNTIYKSANKRTIRDLTVTTPASGYELSLDNLVFEKNKKSYEEATKPTKDSVYYGFENGAGDVIISGNAAVEYYAQSASYGVRLTQSAKGASVTVPINHRANLYSVVLFDADIYFANANTNGEINTITFYDNDGAAIFALALKVNGDLVEIYEVGKNGTLSTRIAKAEKKDKLSLGIELYQKKNLANIFVGGKCVARTSVFADPDLRENKPMTAVVSSSSTKATVFVDNLRAESLYRVYEDVKVNSEANTDSTNPLNFEQSSTGSIPTGIIKSAKNFRVDHIYNSAKGEYSNVGVLDTVRGVNETIGVTLGNAVSASCITFETDFMISGIEYEMITQIFLTGAKANPASDAVYGMIFRKSGDSISISDYANGTTATTLVSGLSPDTWYNLKVEYYALDNGEARIRVFLDGDLKYVTANHYFVGKESARKNVGSAFFYTFLDSKCSIFVDNMSLTTSNATCNDTVGAK